MELARCLSVSLKGNKKGQKAKNANLSPLVTPPGFKPGTF